MTREHETKIEMMGREYCCMVTYELDHGWPVICQVEISAEKPSLDYERDVPKTEKLTFDATDWLNKDQEAALEDEIDCALKAEAAAMDADRRAMEREERVLFRRAA